MGMGMTSRPYMHQSGPPMAYPTHPIAPPPNFNMGHSGMTPNLQSHHPCDPDDWYKSISALKVGMNSAQQNLQNQMLQYPTG